MSDKEKEINEFRDAFALFDKDAAGVVSLNDFKSMLRTLKDPAESQLLEMFTEVEDDGCMNFERFVSIMTNKMKDPDPKEMIEESFKVFDRDGNGLVSAAELRHSLTNMGEKLADDEVDEMILEQDIDRDGNVNYHDIMNNII